MAIIKNPYGVGESGEDRITIHPRCECCCLRFNLTTSRLQPRLVRHCSFCESHNLAGTDGERAEALAEHEPRLLDWIGRVEDKADQLARRNTDLQIKLNDARAQVASALESRDRYRQVANAAMSVHGQDGSNGCSCGKPYPCLTVRAVNEADEGIAHWYRRSG